ncbi:response regulator [Azospirillum sp. SYSU D00513]|uniref:response regulator n=1 Tax=Azospirillum sp. SYSU D00513 TaxID=2812561 RepID=UPI001A97D316|nr:response regulator [Azospirillum sp. SYSU D00513]
MTQHVIVAEDEGLIALGYKYVLVEAGYKVTCCPDGVKALEAFRKTSADLILTDLRMPNLDGLGLVEQVRQISPDVPVIIASGHVTPDSAIPNSTGAFTSIVMKPVCYRALLKAVKAALS